MTLFRRRACPVLCEKYLTTSLQCVFTVFFFLCSGCSSTDTKSVEDATDTLNPISENYRLPRKVAVLPFKNETPDTEAATQVRRIFYNYFSSLNYRDAELSSVDEVVSALGGANAVLNGESLPWEVLCQKLNVDGFVTGTVHEYGKMYAVLYSQTAVTLSVQFRSCHNGGYIWQRKTDSTKRDGDIPLSPTSLAAAVFTTYFRHQDISALEVAAKLSMELTLSMPNPPSLLAAPPEITFFVHNASGRLLLPGEKLKVVMRGVSGAKGFWSIPGLAERLPMEEKEPGIYLGQYEVKPKDRLLDTQLVGYLVSEENAESRWIDILEPVTIGQPTVLPSIIDSDMTLTAEQSPYLISDIVLVKKGAVLSIQPGVTLWSDGAGIVINGQLQALGLPDNPILFRSLSDALWKGITFKDAVSSVVNYVEISHADIALNVYQSVLSGKGLSLEGNSWGLVAQNADVTVVKSHIRHSRKVGLAIRNSQASLTHNRITDNLAGGVMFENSMVNAKLNAIFNNGEWELNNLDGDRSLLLDYNWWGTTNSQEIKVKGDAVLEPMLESYPQTNLTLPPESNRSE